MKLFARGQIAIEFVAVLPLFLAMFFIFVKVGMFLISSGYFVVGEFGTKREEANLKNAAAYNCGDNGLFGDAGEFCKNEE